jgi:tetratricopeptide (TPR) repeat protein
MKKKKQQQGGKKSSLSAKVNVLDSWKYYAALGGILLVTLVAYLPILQNGLLDWDDHAYINNNPLVHSIDLKQIFSRYVQGNYHPLTILTLAIEFHFFGLNATAYHAVNLVLHLMNVVLVFYAILLLSNKPGIALVVSLLFGIHPLHVESVAWAVELKDLLYTFFFLASYIFYLKYIKEKQTRFYVFALLLFLTSLLSKAMAASLPMVMVLTDYFLGRKFDRKSLIEKAPFFALAIALGIVAVLAQQSSDAIQDMELFTFPQRIAFASYGFITYLFKLLFPLQLSAYYPYPMKSPNGDIPISFYAYVLLVAVFSAAVFYSIRTSRKLIFGIGFFSVTIFLVLQLLPVGSTIMADRYSYIPSIGIFYLAAEGLLLLWEKNLQVLAICLLGVFTIFFSTKTYARCGIWKNEITLWTDVIDQNQTIAPVYNNRGAAYQDEKRYTEAIADFTKAVELKPDYAEPYNNRAVIFTDENKYPQALDDLNKAIAAKPRYAEAYSNRGIVFMQAKKYDEALSDYSKAIELNPSFTEAYVNRANILRDMKKFDQALKDYNKAIEINPDFPKAYVNRGTLFMLENKSDDALRDLAKAIALKPDLAEAYYDRGIVFYNEKKYPDAIADYSKAIELKTNYADAYFNRGVAKYYAGDKQGCCADLQQAGRMGHPSVAGAYAQLCN